MTETVSVLIPCYRAEQFVSRALESVLAQTLERWEVVLCDNASDDDTWRIAQEYALRDPRIRVYRNPVNIGPVRNWRRCAELANGRNAALLFVDDWYEPTFLAETAHWLTDRSIGFVFSTPRVVREDGSSTVPEATLPRGKVPSQRFLEARFCGSGIFTPVSPGCAMFRREDLVASLSAEPPDPYGLGYMRHGAGPDVRIYLDALSRYPSFAHVSESLVSFHSHRSNLSWRPEVAAAYHATFVQWCERNKPQGISVGRVKAHAWFTMREHPMRAQVVPRLTLAAAAHLPGVVADRLTQRMRQVVKRLRLPGEPA